MYILSLFKLLRRASEQSSFLRKYDTNACCMFVQISNVQTWWSTENNQAQFGTCIKGRTIALIKGKMIFFFFVCLFYKTCKRLKKNKFP